MNEGAGDWICSDQSCGNINFARRVSCYRCNKDRPDGGKMFKKKLGTEIGKSAAEKSRGLFNADDWQCNKCANVNWARRTTCNVCNAPKFGEVEARTGYGGGYNERGVVEYRRREPSSDDEYDEFGRKKRKRKPEGPNVVGITEGPLVKKLPPTLLPMELNMDAKEDPAPNVVSNKDHDKARGSLSDSSVSVELPLLSKFVFRKNQRQNQTNYHRQNHVLPSFKTNGNYTRKRFTSSTDQDLGETAGNPPKRARHVSKNSLKFYDQSIENRLQPSKDDVVFKFTAGTPTSNYKVTYSIEERVKVAAFAIVYNNCKISTEKFESLYDKPAPDFKTIYAWRQRLLSTGCLIDTHISPPCCHKTKISNFKPPPNPDEIPISSDSETECIKSKKKTNSINATALQRSISTETLVICNNQKVSGSSANNTEEHTPQTRDYSTSNFRVHSSSQDTQESNDADSDLDKESAVPAKSKMTDDCDFVRNKQSTTMSNSDSDSISYDSDYVDFLSRVYGEGKKSEHKLLKKQTPVDGKSNCQLKDLQIFQGYCTVKKSDQSPLATGNIYTSNVRNMRAKGNISFTDADTSMAEYVPTKLGSSTIKNYQDFKNDVKKKGFWAKGNCAKFQKNNQPSSDKTRNDHTTAKKAPMILNNELGTPLHNSVAVNDKASFLNIIPGDDPDQLSGIEPHGDDFTNDDFEQIAITNNYTSFDKPIQNETTSMLQANDTTIMSSEDSSRIFDLVQSDAGPKTRSIMEIFDLEHCVSPECVGSEKTPSKSYRMVWDEDDDALYNDSGEVGVQDSSHNLSSVNNPEQQVSNSNNVLFGFEAENEDVKSKKCPNVIGSGVELVTKCSMISNSPHKNTRSILSQVIKAHSGGDKNIFMDKTKGSQVTQIEKVEKVCFSENAHSTPNKSKNIKVIESITLTPQAMNIQESVTAHNLAKPQSGTTTTANNVTPIQNTTVKNVNSLEHPKTTVNLSNIWAGINTDTLLLALQNLQHIAQKSEEANKQNGQTVINNVENNNDAVETINLTNDEDWEKESDKEGSVERQLKRIHGNTGDTPFLSDIFDPGPVLIPPNVAKKLNINLQPDEDKVLPDTSETTPVIGNFKSFALPKPIMLNRLKLSMKPPDKTVKHTADARKRKRKRKSRPSEGKEEESGAAEGAEEGDEEESGDDADLSKYDLWGSDDDDRPRTSKPETTDKNQDGEDKGGDSDKTNKNGQAAPVDSKTAKRRSRSSSSSTSSSSSSSSSHSSAEAPKNKFDDFNLNSERESPPGSPSRRSRSPHAAHARAAAPRRKRDSRSAGESRGRESSRDKERAREHGRRASRAGRERPERAERAGRKERRYSRDGPGNYFGARGRHR